MANFLSKVFDDFFDKSSNTLEINSKYNIEKISYDKYMVTMAVPGYKKNNLKIRFNKGILTIRGIQEVKDEHCSKDFLYHGFTTKSFENSFSLSDRLEVIEANLSNGILHIILKDKSSQKDIISPINDR